MRTPRLEWSELKRHGLGLLPQPRESEGRLPNKTAGKTVLQGAKVWLSPTSPAVCTTLVLRATCPHPTNPRTSTNPITKNNRTQSNLI